jgi:hypothetical protein
MGLGGAIAFFFLTISVDFDQPIVGSIGDVVQRIVTGKSENQNASPRIFSRQYSFNDSIELFFRHGFVEMARTVGVESHNT